MRRHLLTLAKTLSVDGFQSLQTTPESLVFNKEKQVNPKQRTWLLIAERFPWMFLLRRVSTKSIDFAHRENITIKRIVSNHVLFLQPKFHLSLLMVSPTVSLLRTAVCVLSTVGSSPFERALKRLRACNSPGKDGPPTSQLWIQPSHSTWISFRS